MGRHSAPDGEGTGEPTQEQRVVAVLDVATLLGRHSPGRPAPRSRRAPDNDGDSGPLPVVEMEAPERAEPDNAADQAGLALIEDALAAVPAEAPPADAAPVAVEDAHTAQIAPVVEPEPSMPEAPTAQIPLVGESVVEEPVVEDAVVEDAVAAGEPVVAATPAEAPPDPSPAPPGARAASSDLALLRAHGDVRARCLAAVLVPFVLYVVALVLIGSLALATFLIWIWIPLISAGILVGFFLDTAHKRYGPPAGAPVSGSADRP